MKCRNGCRRCLTWEKYFKSPCGRKIPLTGDANQKPAVCFGVPCGTPRNNKVASSLLTELLPMTFVKLEYRRRLLHPKGFAMASLRSRADEVAKRSTPLLLVPKVVIGRRHILMCRRSNLNFYSARSYGSTRQIINRLLRRS